jgi:FkbM family methyltransferase
MRFKLLISIYRLSSGKNTLGRWINVLKCSKSQLFQELFVVSALDFKVGHFLEVGGTDGILLSNTLALEEMGWNGAIFEPCRFWHRALKENRKCLLDFRAVTNTDNESISFSETSIPELSTITSRKPQDGWTERRVNSLDYLVETITLNTALNQFNFPSNLDYLSIDTEGTEFEVLEGLNFQMFNFKVVTVEIAGDVDKGLKIKKFLEDNGFRQVFEGKTFWDDWYLHQTLYSELASKGRLTTI